MGGALRTAETLLGATAAAKANRAIRQTDSDSTETRKMYSWLCVVYNMREFVSSVQHHDTTRRLGYVIHTTSYGGEDSCNDCHVIVM